MSPLGPRHPLSQPAQRPLRPPPTPSLRNCTRLQNRYWHAGQSQYRGVCPQGDIWMATVGYYGNRIYVGLFDDETEAAKVRDRKAYEPAGPFAYLNFPHEIPR